MIQCSAGYEPGKARRHVARTSASAQKPIPKLVSAHPSERLELFARKLHACCTRYNYQKDDEDVHGKALKLSYLQEILLYMGSIKGILKHESIYSLTAVMIGRNIFRTFPPKTQSDDADDDEGIMDPAWPCLDHVYQYFLQFLESDEFQPNVAKKHFDSRFVIRLLHTFASEDYRERNMLKTVLHRIYGKFLGLRGLIRKQISFIFLSFLYDDEDCRGVSEILEFLGSIINGFSLPLKSEHIEFLDKVLIPLHTSKDLTYFQPQLVYCVVQYMEKDPKTAENVVRGLLKFWPKLYSPKEVMFLGELEELIDAMQPGEFAKLREPILKQLAKCVQCLHFQVAERALCIWDNEYFSSLIDVSAEICYPIFLKSVEGASRTHWDNSINDLAKSVLSKLEESNPSVYVTILGRTKPSKRNRKNLWQRAAMLSRLKLR